MTFDDQQILELLFSQHYISEEQYKQAQEEGAVHGSSVDFLKANGVINDDLIGQAISESLHVPYADLNSHTPTKELIDLLQSDVAVKFRVIPFREENGSVAVATDAPQAEGLEQAIQSGLQKGKKVTSIAYALTQDVDVALRYYQKPLSDRLKEVVASGGRAPEVVDMIIGSAVDSRASDVHMEPQDELVIVRFRVDGVMMVVGDMEPVLYEMVLNRIKVLSRLRTDRHQAAQDGSIRYHVVDRPVDLRVSIVPTFDGEKVVMRLLTQYSKDFSLRSLGISEAHRQLLTELSNKPFGMIVVCGPTGSGKTTTLYGVLKQLNRPEVNISTIEDPVEYKIRGVNHIQVNKETELTFAAGLRSIVRQDPDIILVGEIRDHETAEISVNAALTGHLLLSTFHANDSSTAIPRLLDMGIEPFLLSSTLSAILSQRLVRTICDSCRYSYMITTKELDAIDKRIAKMITGSSFRFYKGKGCSHCGHTGFKGRTAIFEIILISNELREVIMREPTGQRIWEIAEAQGSRSMFEDGLQKVVEGVTTIEELLRVAEPPSRFFAQKFGSAPQKEVKRVRSKKAKNAP